MALSLTGEITAEHRANAARGSIMDVKFFSSTAVRNKQTEWQRTRERENAREQRGECAFRSDLFSRHTGVPAKRQGQTGSQNSEGREGIEGREETQRGVALFCLSWS
eukprot:COSAG02_NODE_3279_length_7026_cov_21.473798_1_plen_107_part_00